MEGGEEEEKEEVFLGARVPSVGTARKTMGRGGRGGLESQQQSQAGGCSHVV